MLQKPDSAQTNSPKAESLGVSVLPKSSEAHKRDTAKRAETITKKEKEPKSEPNFNPGFEIDPLAALLFVLAYILDKIYTHIVTNTNNRANWYLEVIVKPKLNDVEKFYDDALRLFDMSFTTLTSAFGSSATGYVALVAQETDAFLELISKFDINFITLLSSHDLELEIKARDHQFKLGDLVTSSFSSFNILSLDRALIKESLIRNKIEFYQILYEPVIHKYRIWRAIKKWILKKIGL